MLSSHDFTGVPVYLEARAAAMKATGAEVIKLAVMVKRLSDCLPLLALGRSSTTPMALVGMGDAENRGRLQRQGRDAWRGPRPLADYGATSQTQNGSVAIAAICSVVVSAAINGASPPMARAMT